MESTQKNTEKWQQTLDALDSAAKGKVVNTSEVYKWLNSWGTENELEAPKLKSSTDMLKG
ncbi:hypothetical protein [Marinomonas shanghaiensis]|uniref:hypothetical protein n=1 Tax=Marinomonas shanghaiensis TaxID=2202418 RepID=UPI003A94D40F